MNATAMQLQQNAPDLAQFINSFVVAGQSIEMIDQYLYDRLQYPTAGPGVLSFFQTALGNGQTSESTGAAGVTKSYADTNLEGTGGQLPAPMAFWVKNLQVDFDPGSVSTANVYTNLVPTFYVATGAVAGQSGVNDKETVLNAGFLSFDIGQKNYFRGGPLRMFPNESNFRLDSSVATAGTNAQPNMIGNSFLRSEGPAGMPVKSLDPGVGIPTSMNFKLNAVFPIVQATPSGFNGRMQARLGGWLLRAVQ